MTSSTRVLTIAALAAVCLLWVGAAMQGWWIGQLESDLVLPELLPGSEQRANTLGHVPADRLPSVLWAGGDAARRWARRLMLPPNERLPEAEAVLHGAMRERPIYAPLWLDWAELLRSGGDLDRADRAIEIAVALWPGRPRLLQRAAWMQTGMDSPQRALTALMDYWALAPTDSLRTLALARRLSRNESELVEAAEQVWRRGPAEPLVYQSALLNLASQARDLRLARSLWARLDAGSRKREELLFPYLQLLTEQAQYAEADATWQQTLGDPPGIANGGFEEPLTPLGAGFRPGWGTPGWRFQPVGEAYRMNRDAERRYAGRYSLEIAFAGTENIDLAQPSQVVRVRPGHRYRLRGQWSGNALTTRSGVFVEIYSIDGRTPARAQTAPRWGTWNWEPFEMEIQVPEDCLRLAVRVRRVRTSALDRLLGGVLWLDELVLEPAS